MPHAVLNQSVDLEEFSKKMEPIVSRDNFFVKIENIFVDKHKQSALIPVFVMDEERQKFFIEILTNVEKTTVRLFPLTDPKKTKGVKTALGLVTSNLLKHYEDAKIVKTNIEEFIP